MWDFLERTALILGRDALERLEGSRVAVLGLGGVGGSAAEALCRAGVGSLLLVDSDAVSPSNLNRQLLATRDTLGMAKVQAARARLEAVNPLCRVETAARFYLPEDSDFLYRWEPDYVLDAVDTVTAKLHLAQECRKRGIPLTSSMGTGNRLDPSLLRLGDISETTGNGCPLCRVMRRELKRRDVPALEVVYSLEPPAKGVCAGSDHGRHSPGSSAFVPPAAGCLLAWACAGALTGLRRGDKPDL